MGVLNLNQIMNPFCKQNNETKVPPKGVSWQWAGKTVSETESLPGSPLAADLPSPSSPMASEHRPVKSRAAVLTSELCTFTNY